MSLTGHHAVVTGAGSGIGRATAERLAEAGCQVTLIGRHVARLNETADRIGDLAFAAPADVTDPDMLAAAIEAGRDRFGPVDILINNAGAASSAPFLKTDADALRAMLKDGAPPLRPLTEIEKGVLELVFVKLLDAVQSRWGSGAELTFHLEALVDGKDPRVARTAAGVKQCIVAKVGIEGHGLVALATAPVPVTVTGQIRADLMNPGRKSRRSPEGSQHAVGADEGVLGDFFGVLAVAQQGKDLCEDTPLILQDQFVISRKIPLTGTVQGGLVGFGLH